MILGTKVRIISLSYTVPSLILHSGVEFLALVVGKCPLENFNQQSGTRYMPRITAS